MTDREGMFRWGWILGKLGRRALVPATLRTRPPRISFRRSCEHLRVPAPDCPVQAPIATAGGETPRLTLHINSRVGTEQDADGLRRLPFPMPPAFPQATSSDQRTSGLAMSSPSRKAVSVSEKGRVDNRRIMCVSIRGRSPQSHLLRPRDLSTWVHSLLNYRPPTGSSALWTLYIFPSSHVMSLDFVPVQVPHDITFELGIRFFSPLCRFVT